VSTFPANLSYTAEHEWLAPGDPVTFGITDTASEALGDIVYLELPASVTRSRPVRRAGRSSRPSPSPSCSPPSAAPSSR